MSNTVYTLETLVNETNFAKKMVDTYKRYKGLTPEERATEFGPAYYQSIPTACQEAQAEYGAENIFLIEEDYHGKYEDDYCYFTYYNNVTGETFNDTWSTAYAAPSYSNFECIPYWRAFELGLVNKEKVFNLLKERAINWIKNYKINPFPGDFDKYNLKVKVSRGRKWKGEGYLINSTTSTYSWGPSYGKGYNQSTTRTAYVFVPDENEIHEVNAAYCEFVDLETTILNNWKLWAINKINNTGIDQLDPHRFQVVWPSHKLVTYLNLLMELIPIDYSTAVNKAEEERKAKAEAKLNKLHEDKMPGIIEWVKTKTDKTTEEEIMELAERIFKKNYC